MSGNLPLCLWIGLNRKEIDVRPTPICPTVFKHVLSCLTLIIFLHYVPR